jgi:hypothetical protein
MLSAFDALTIASVCIFLAGVATGRRSNEGYRIHLLITLPHYAGAFLALGCSPVAYNYGLNYYAPLALLTLFMFGTFGENFNNLSGRLKQ